jgi:hypothetical protein
MRRILMRHAVVLGVVVSLSSSLPSTSFSQDRNAEIRQQIEALQRQLDAAEQQATAKRNVTQIGASRAKKQSTGMVVRIYELNDLFAVAPPYAAQIASDLGGLRYRMFDSTEGMMGQAGIAGFGGGGIGGNAFGSGGFGGGVFSVGARNAATAISSTVAGQAGNQSTIKTAQDELVNVIKTTISPDLWAGDGKISKMGNAFIISADEETHTQIEAMLNLFRERWGTLRTISVRGWWVSLPAAELRTLLDDPTEKATADGPPVFGLVSDAAWKRVLQLWEQPAADAGKRLSYQATLTAYNGQTVSTQSGVQGLAVSGIETVMAENSDGQRRGDPGYNPSVSVVQEGLAFQVTPIANVSGRTVLLDIHSRLALPFQEPKPAPPARPVAADAAAADTKPAAEPRPGGFGDRPAFGGAANIDPRVLNRSTAADVARTIDARRLLVHRLSTTARVPADRPYLVGGMSLASNEADGQNLYLFVKVTVQELRNDTEKADAAAKPAADEDEDKAPKAEKKPEKAE